MDQDLASRLTAARKRKNLSQVQVKSRTGINNKTLSGYERGISEPDAETLVTLANLYEVSVDWLYGNQQDTKKFIEDVQREMPIQELQSRYELLTLDGEVMDKKEFEDAIAYLRAKRMMKIMEQS